MKTLGSILLFVLMVVACDPYNFGFKKNPAYVLNEAFNSISNHDLESFLEVTGKEALCIYGNDKGLAYLKESIVITLADIKLKPTVLKSTHLTTPTFGDYWSYYQERYQIDILDKNSNDLIMNAIVDCEFGTDGPKDQSWVNLEASEYKRKECRIVKVMPKKFKPLPLSTKCEVLKVTL
jgi:hypothetical protein